MGRKGERAGEKLQCVRNKSIGCLSHARPANQACALTGNGTSSLSVLRSVLNSQSHTSQGDFFFFLKILCIYLFLESGERREKERERNVNRSPLAHTLTTY